MVSLPEFWILVYESVRVVAQLFGIFRTIQFSLFFQMAQDPNIVFGDHGAATSALLSMSQHSEVFPGSNLLCKSDFGEQHKKYGLGSGCHAEPRVGESIGSKQHDRNKLGKTEGRPNELENLVPLNHQEKRLLFHKQYRN
jgi:hypothetical protein